MEVIESAEPLVDILKIAVPKKNEITIALSLLIKGKREEFAKRCDLGKYINWVEDRRDGQGRLGMPNPMDSIHRMRHLDTLRKQ